MVFAAINLFYQPTAVPVLTEEAVSCRALFVPVQLPIRKLMLQVVDFVLHPKDVLKCIVLAAPVDGISGPSRVLDNCMHIAEWLVSDEIHLSHN